MEKVNTTIEFCIFKLVYVPNFKLNWQFLFLGPNLLKNNSFSFKQKKWIQYWTVHIQICLGTKFQLKMTICIFWTISAQKGYFLLKVEKVKINIEFGIFWIGLQSCSKYFEIFWWLSKFSFHHKWNKAWF